MGTEVKAVADKPKEEVKKAPVKAAGKPAPKKKNPKKEKSISNVWTIEDFENETVTLEGADISHKHGVRVFGCKNTEFNINGKVKSIMFEGCRGCRVNIQSSVSPIELCNSERMKLYLLKSIPLVNIEKSRDCTVNLM